MKLRYIGISGSCLTNGKEYEILDTFKGTHYIVVENSGDVVHTIKTDFEALELASKRVRATVYNYIFEGRNDGSEPVYYEAITVIMTVAEDEETKFYCKWDREDLDLFSEQKLVKRNVVCQKYFEEGEEAQFKEFLELFHLGRPSSSDEDNLEPKPHYKTVYERVQRYGGAEEGGWHYHNYIATDLSEDEVELGTIKYGEGYTLEHELFKHEHENTASQHYC